MRGFVFADCAFFSSLRCEVVIDAVSILIRIKLIVVTAAIHWLSINLKIDDRFKRAVLIWGY